VLKEPQDPQVEQVLKEYKESLVRQLKVLKAPQVLKEPQVLKVFRVLLVRVLKALLVLLLFVLGSTSTAPAPWRSELVLT
jgi:hypothetical protein